MGRKRLHVILSMFPEKQLLRIPDTDDQMTNAINLPNDGWDWTCQNYITVTTQEIHVSGVDTHLPWRHW